MAFSASNHEPQIGERHIGEYSSGDYGVTGDVKYTQDKIDHEEIPNADVPNRRMEAPPLVRVMTQEDRVRTEKALLRKIDLRLLPMIILMYIMNYLDRNNIAAARLAGLQDDLKLTSVQYQTSVSILFVGYILMQTPSNLLLNKIGLPAIYLPSCMIVWGTISAATAGIHSYGGLVTVRFFLGFVEAAYFPGCLFFLSSWYTRKELALRTATLYSGSLISGAFSGLIAAGITSGLDGVRGLRAWRWLFIIEGVVTIGIAMAAYLEDIGTDDWVSSEQQSFWHGMKLACLDIKMWILMTMLFGIVASGSVTNFFPTVVKTLGYNNINSLLLTAPPYALAVITTFANAWHADRTGESYDCDGAAIRGDDANGSGRVHRRAAALAAINAVSNSSSIYASYMYPQSAGPRYKVAMAVNCATIFLAICMATLLRVILVRLNKRLDRGE
ncbi:hypothetical protein B0A49_00930 [Cryomyces minteri]|uniref:Major facilitator superfamily (MFS) profile domain-containing protein n=1 Tax=Cryomyces minteri TaxID=331657 RepID=A0A4U0XKP6_9PEZI|nr:hypothetical protein B0A49_00930 [Cryomyces minteri]